MDEQEVNQFQTIGTNDVWRIIQDTEENILRYNFPEMIVNRHTSAVNRAMSEYADIVLRHTVDSISEVEVQNEEIRQVNERKMLEKSVQPSRKNKAMAEWSISSRILKSLINDVVLLTPSRQRWAYKFSVVKDHRLNLWYIWNNKTQNIIATVKIVNANVYIRYRRSSYYSPILSDFNIKGRDVVCIESNNLSRGRQIARNGEHVGTQEELTNIRIERRERND